MPNLTRRDVLGAAATSAAALALPRFLSAADDRSAIYAEIEKRHGEAVARLQDWVRNPVHRRRKPRHGDGLRSDDVRS